MGEPCSAFKLPGTRVTAARRRVRLLIMHRSAEAVPGSLWGPRSLSGGTAPPQFQQSISLSPLSSQHNLRAQLLCGQRGSLNRWRQSRTSRVTQVLKPVDFVRPCPRDIRSRRVARPFSSSGRPSSAPAGLRFVGPYADACDAVDVREVRLFRWGSEPPPAL